VLLEFAPELFGIAVVVWVIVGVTRVLPRVERVSARPQWVAALRV